uniref:DEAD-box ATP-dependent RNA helicase 42 n=1 Tax=Erigeron canadensis TaxID=72917 RepID=UPI001CB9C18B|nr:DEAD-box ATP-dependent RNA helicase 42 [Erigeron canadensis]
MAKDRDDQHKSKRKSESESESDISSESDHHRSSSSKKHKIRHSRKKSRRRRRSYDSDSDSDSDSDTDSESETGSSEYDSESESEEERRRRKRKERKRKEERDRKRRKEKKRKRRDDDDDDDKKRKKDKKKKKSKDKGTKKKVVVGAVTDSWGKYGIIRETDMWTKRPEFTAWLAEVKQVNLESLPNWEEKQMFKQFMEDHNTATFPSKKYYSLDAYHRKKIEKAIKKGSAKAAKSERIVFNDEEQRRLELQQEREKQKEAEVEALKRSMQSGMAQAMKEQDRLREEMNYLFKIGNVEAATAIQRRLDPDLPM